MALKAKSKTSVTVKKPSTTKSSAKPKGKGEAKAKAPLNSPDHFVEMKDAALEAAEELQEAVGNELTGEYLLEWHKRFTKSAGYKWLGKIMNHLETTDDEEADLVQFVKVEWQKRLDKDAERKSKGKSKAADNDGDDD